MKRFVLLNLMVVAVAWCAAAQNRFYIEDFEIAAGETRSVSFLLDNETEYTAFQCDVSLPQGFTATHFALTSRKSSNHTLSAIEQPDGCIRLLSYSILLKTYSGHSGPLVTMDLTVPDDFAGTAVIALRNMIFTTEGGVETQLADESCTVTAVSDKRPGDVNNDCHVTITDVTALIDFLLGDDTGINHANADVNNDGSISITDVTALIDMLLSN